MKIFTKCNSPIVIVFFAIFTLAISSCKKNNSGEVVKGETKVKMVNAVQTEFDQDVYLDNEKLSNVPLGFAETTDYLKISSGNRNVSFIGTDNIATKATVNFIPSITYTTFLISDESNNREIVAYEDNLSSTDAGKVKIKFINLTPYFNKGIDVNVQGGTQFVNDLMFKQASNYFSVDSGINLKYNVVGSGSIKTISGTDLVAGKIYTVWFSGSTAAALEAHIIADN